MRGRSAMAGASGFAILLFGCSPWLEVATSSLPDGTVGVSYAHTILVTGGESCYALVMGADGLPPGLGVRCANEGDIRGTPTVAGDFSVTLSAWDDASFAGPETAVHKTVPLKIYPAVSFTTQALPDGAVAVADLSITVLP